MVVRSSDDRPPGGKDGSEGQAVQALEKREIKMIEEALAKLGDFGEVRLAIEKGRLPHVVTQRSYDPLKWSPGQMQ